MDSGRGMDLAALTRLHYVISQPADVDVNEMIIRTVRSAGHAF